MKPKIGAFVLETFTVGMYTNPLDTIREFIQNATDSVLTAEKSGVIDKGMGRVEILVDPEKRRLSIRDNGMGIDEANAIERLINIGMSEKSIETDAGFRGIGRLAGIAYCNTLKFKTSYRGEEVATVIRMDCSRMRELSSAYSKKRTELADLIYDNCEMDQETGKSEEHYFEVTMEDVTDAGEEFLDWNKLEEYLGQVAPVEYDSHRFVYAPKIKDWVNSHGLYIPTIMLIIKTPVIERQVFKPYKTHYRTKKENYDIEIKDVTFFPEEPARDAPFWIWYSMTDLLGMISDESVAGLRLRKNNISLGGAERISEMFAMISETNRRFNSYFIGEVHVTAPGAIPNARRDGFESEGDWPDIRDQIMPLLEELCERVRKASSVRNRPLVKIKSSATSVIKDAREKIARGLSSESERDNLLNRVKREEERVSLAKEAHKGTGDYSEIKAIDEDLQSICSTLEQESIVLVKNIRPELDRKQRKLLQEIVGIIYETTSSIKCNKNETCYKLITDAILDKYQVKDNEIV